jgi:hypothetical protein
MGALDGAAVRRVVLALQEERHGEPLRQRRLRRRPRLLNQMSFSIFPSVTSM